MHHHVRITTDRRGKVRIVIECQPVVSDVVGRIGRLGHRTDRQRRNEVLLLLAVNRPHQLVDLLCHRLIALRLHVVSEPNDKAAELCHLVRIRFVMDTVHKRPLAVLDPFPFLPDKFRHLTVGQQHELLDQLVRLLDLLEIDTQRFAVLVQFEFGLLALEIDRTVAEAFAPQLLSQAIQLQNLYRHIALTGLYHLLRLLIGKPTVGIDHRPAKPLLLHLSLLVQLENGREAELFLMRSQGTQTIGEPFGKHRHRTVDQIDRRGPGLSLRVDQVSGFDVMGHIRNMYSHLEIPVG